MNMKYINVPSGKPGRLTWQWKMDLSKGISLLFPIEDGDFHCHVG